MPDPLDPTERAHLVDPADRTWRMWREPVSRELTDLARSFWIPVWDVPDPGGATQHVLQYPVCLLVVSDSYSRFYGVTSGLSETTLHGRGWAVGLMLRPAAGWLLWQAPVQELTDRHVGLGEVPGLDGAPLTRAVREAMSGDPTDDATGGAQARARAHVEAALAPCRSVDPEGLTVNEIVDAVEGDPGLTRVRDLVRATGLTERSLQRLLQRRVGIGPKWLIRRRRLHEANELLRASEDSPTSTLADIAARLGYADQSHFSRDYRRATGLTPAQFARRFRAEP